MKNTELFSYTSEYLTRNGRPWFPVMGEFHYSRYPDSYWEESLYKMKVCGVDVVSAYVIWIHHEEEEGKYLFSGCRDLHKFFFLDAAKKCGLLVFLRIGHGAMEKFVTADFRTGCLRRILCPVRMMKAIYPA